MSYVYFVVLREDDSADESERGHDSSFVQDAFDQSVQFTEDAWVVASDEVTTCGDVLKKLGVAARGCRADWSCIVLPMDGYNGFAERSSWEKIDEWRESR